MGSYSEYNTEKDLRTLIIKSNRPIAHEPEKI